MNFVKKKILHMVMMQTIKTNDFLQYYRHLQSKKRVAPLVVKGNVCGSIYPQPDYRIFEDEDMKILEEKCSGCYEAMVDFEMQLVDSEEACYPSIRRKIEVQKDELLNDLLPI